MPTNQRPRLQGGHQEVGRDRREEEEERKTDNILMPCNTR